jgi:hypothetical protein
MGTKATDETLNLADPPISNIVCRDIIVNSLAASLVGATPDEEAS